MNKTSVVSRDMINELRLEEIKDKKDHEEDKSITSFSNENLCIEGSIGLTHQTITGMDGINQ